MPADRADVPSSGDARSSASSRDLEKSMIIFGRHDPLRAPARFLRRRARRPVIIFGTSPRERAARRFTVQSAGRGRKASTGLA
jgi:hypothetical protein